MTSKILEKLSLYHHCQKLLLKLKSLENKIKSYELLQIIEKPCLIVSTLLKLQTLQCLVLGTKVEAPSRALSLFRN